jgi:hypothetical protein
MLSSDRESEELEMKRILRTFVGASFLCMIIAVCTVVSYADADDVPATISGYVGDCLDLAAEYDVYIDEIEDTDIYALQDNITTEGSFFLGSGHIDDELKYFYVKETDIGYTVCNVDADQSYIRYTDDRCHIEKQTCAFTNEFVNWIAFPFNDTRYIFHIPDGSIMNNYVVDLK